MSFEEIDATDRRILAALQTDCRQSLADLAAAVNLSPSTCHRRVRLLEERGIIDGYVARLDGRRLGFAMEFFVEITLDRQTEGALEAFEAAVRRVPEILECHLMTGAFDYLLRVGVLDKSDYERIHRDRLGRLPGTVRIQSSLALRTVKPWAGYPVASI
ncbi:MAG: Lrp/AsnC family transcriptional regulator [Pseudomonadota bacterium]